MLFHLYILTDGQFVRVNSIPYTLADVRQFLEEIGEPVEGLRLTLAA